MVIKITDSFSLVQGKPICAPSCLSEVTPMSPLKQFQCLIDDGPLLSFSGRSSGTSMEDQVINGAWPWTLQLTSQTLREIPNQISSWFCHHNESLCSPLWYFCVHGGNTVREMHIYTLRKCWEGSDLWTQWQQCHSPIWKSNTQRRLSMAKLTQGLINHWCGQTETMAVLHKWSVWSWFELANKAACLEEGEALDEASVVGLGSDGTQADHELFQTPDHQACGSSHDQVLQFQGSRGQNVQWAN